MLIWEERHLLWRGVILAEEIDRLAPDGLLDAIDLPAKMKKSGWLSPFGRFTEVKHMPLDDAVICEPPIFDDTPIEVRLAIFKPF